MKRFTYQLKTPDNLLIGWGFPEAEIMRWLRENAVQVAENFTTRKVSDLYELYEEGIQSGLPVFKQGQATPILDYMESRSNYSRSDIRMFCYALFESVRKGRINQKWYDPQLKEKRSIMTKIKTKAAAIGPATITKTLSNVKWIGITALAGVGLYLAFPYIKLLTRTVKKRRKT